MSAPTAARDVVLVDTPAPLPRTDHRAPACGACGDETSWNDGFFDCENCGLSYDDADLDVSFTDEEAEPCLHPCENTWHGSPSLGPYECHPCALPAGHPTKFHWTGCTKRKAAQREH